MKYILTLLFGYPTQGEKLQTPTTPSARPLDYEDFNKWSNEFKVGSRYGTKGSFYFDRKSCLRAF